ncbi:TRAP transporter small permease [Ramlibacter sp.]|uniref:TRAP transporter small permease n=1 Tax=Ramlibacter sp. TaxID=1917967 RepID=UPI0035B1BF43
MSALTRAHAAFTRGLFGLACAALVAMLAAYVTEVVLRYCFNAPTRWSSDAVSYAMLVCIAFALPAVTRDNGHVAITSLVERLSPALRAQAYRLLAWLSALACLAAAALLASQGVAQWRDGIETVAAFAIPKWWLSAAAALGFAGAATQYVGHVLQADAGALGGEREV